jgi:beta-glucosidase
LFWFGHGLGYTTWSYDEVSLVEAPTPTVSVTVRNTGDRAGREVVQLYFAPADDTQPVRLVGWAGVRVAPGASATVAVDADARLLRRWDVASSSWAELPRAGRLLVARGLGDLRASLDL